VVFTSNACRRRRSRAQLVVRPSWPIVMPAERHRLRDLVAHQHFDELQLTSSLVEVERAVGVDSDSRRAWCFTHSARRAV